MSNECIICTDNININQNINHLKYMFTCTCDINKFHVECLETWLKEDSTCPLCRNICIPKNYIPTLTEPLLNNDTVLFVPNDNSLIINTPNRNNLLSSCCLLCYVCVLAASLSAWWGIFNT